MMVASLAVSMVAFSVVEMAEQKAVCLVESTVGKRVVRLAASMVASLVDARDDSWVDA